MRATIPPTSGVTTAKAVKVGRNRRNKTGNSERDSDSTRAAGSNSDQDTCDSDRGESRGGRTQTRREGETRNGKKGGREPGGREGGREPGGREAGREGGREAGRDSEGGREGGERARD